MGIIEGGINLNVKVNWIQAYMPFKLNLQWFKIDLKRIITTLLDLTVITLIPEMVNSIRCVDTKITTVRAFSYFIFK